MRPIGIYDKDGVQIFQNDIVEIKKSELIQNLDENFINGLNIDKALITVVDIGDLAGVHLVFHFYSNDKAITNLDYHDWIVASYPNEVQEESHDELKGYFDRKDEFFSYEIKSWHNTSGFYHNFFHRNKKIVKSNLSLSQKEGFHYPISDLKVSVYGKLYPANSNFVVKLDEETKIKCIEAHNSLYGDENYSYKNDFSHIILKCKEIGLFIHEFKNIPVDDNGQLSWVAVVEDYNEKLNRKKTIKRKLKSDFNQWKDENQHLTEEEFDTAKNKHLKLLKDQMDAITNDDSIVYDKIIDNIFLGLTSTLNLLAFFEDNKCEIKINNFEIP